ncbi:filamentous hemagglutinin N-terminal domain-containing protein [uncultured Pseudoteredinibacter sp.]|uniref:filamentous hemagglutinin N-terminal domain-containing protein n=1 Tax=uncultured Pseudoteredinibacter sp. TaxID=1641701 RepID=UPI002614D100|nr:filamentous hemagglutinin N-terminal domain-containing protein [uncultured Pseudoteredinibacter sp.]
MTNFNFSRAKASSKNCRKPLAVAVGLAQLTVIAGFGIEAHAAPEGGRVVQGIGNIEQNANITNVNQVSDLLTVEWSSFDLDSQEVVNFLQPNNQAWVLNHILQNGPSQINGQINANGNVLLINPRGMIFGENALINAGSFTASSLWLDKEDFLNGNFYFKDVDASQGRIINHGLISAATGGFVNLLGESISNEGILSANMGYVSLAAGSELYLTFDDQNFLGVKVTQEVVNNDAGLKAAIDNKGKIEGESARVIMQAESAKDLFDLAVNHEGIIEATGFDGGEVSIAANGAIKMNGNIDSSGDNNSGSVDIAGKSVELLGDIVSRGDVGGRVWVQAEDIQLAASATVDVSGQFGGGQALIGGGYLGRLKGFQNAQSLYVADGAKIYADAVHAGNGGEVILWSDNSTDFQGLISAQGGTQAGDGGLVETSSLNQLSVSGKVSTHARTGQTGTWLLDPGELEIVAGMAAGPNQISVSTIDLVNNNVVITTSDYDAGMAGSGNLTLSADISSVSGNSLTLQAETDIILNNNINITGDVNLDAQNQVFINSNITAANINLDMLSYNVDPTALLSTAGSLSFNYKAGNYALDLNNLGLDFNNISASAINFNLGAGGSNSLNASTTGSDFFITGANALNVDVLAQAINFTGVNSVAGNNNNDSVDAANSGVQLGLSSYTVNDIEISDINSVSNTDSITGTSSAESFTATAENQITVSVGGSNVVFDGVTSLYGGSGTGDSLDVSNQGAVLSASGFDSRSISVSDVELVNNTTTLTGTSNDDSLTVTASKQLLAGSITFNNVDSYDAAAGASDTLDLGGFGAVLDGQNYTVNGISVTQNEISDNVALLTGGGTTDTFVVQGSSASVTANGSTRTYNGVTTVVTQADDIVNLNDQGALISATGFSSQGISFDHASALNTGALTGGVASDTFVVQGAESVTVDAGARTFNGVSAVVTQADDVVNLNDQDALITASGFSSQGINFDHAAALNTGVLTGTAADESFSASAENEVSVVIDGSNRVFGGVDSLDGAGGTADSLDLSAHGATLTATGFNSRGIGVSNIESATNTVNLTGSAADDSVAITGTKEVSGPSISFSGVDNYNAAGGSADVVDANNAGVQLDGSNYIINGVLLSNNETANNVAQLTGGSSQDNFRVEGLNSISVASGSRLFNDVDSLISQADDVLDLNGQDATLSSTGFSSLDIDFSHGSASNTGELTGTSGNDQFDASATNQVTVNINGSDTVFSGVNEVIGGGGDDQADLNNSNADLVATGFDSRSITFSGIGEVIETDELTATAAPEHFVIDGAGGITVNGIRFNGVTVLDGGEAGDDSDQDRISGAVSSFLLAGDESVQVNHLQASSFTANNIELLSGSNATLHGASGDVDTFLVSGLNTVAARDMVFEGVASVFSNTEDTVDLNNLNATLNATGFVSQNIAFDHSSAINTGTLIGTTNSETFTASVANQISVQVNGSNRSFDGVNVLAGGSATGDSLDVQSQGVNLTAAGFTSRGISVSDVALVNNSNTVSGTSADDAVTISANKQLSYNGISFNQVDSYDAGAGSGDNLDASAAGVSVAGTDYTVNGVVVSNNEITNNVAVLTGNAAAADNFIVQGSGSLTANSSERTYNGVTEVVSQADDTVDLNDQNATLTATGFSSQNIAFDHAAAANTGTLTGTNNSETFTASANNQISVQVNGSNISFNGVDTLAGGSATGDSLDVQSQGVNLTATGFTSRGISVSDVALVNNSSTVSGTSADDAVTISANKQLSYIGISFNQVDSYDAGAGSGDNLDASAAGVSVAGTDYTVNGVVVSNNEITNNVAVLTGNAAAADNFIVQGSGSLTANSSERTYNGVTEVVSQADDTVDLNDQNATLTATGFSSQNIAFDHAAAANTGTLTGTNNSEAFTASANNQISVQVNGSNISFNGVDTLAGGSATGDSLDVQSQGVNLTATGFTSRGISVSDVALVNNSNTVSGTSADDAVTISANKQLSYNGISFNQVDSYDAGAGSGDNLDASAAGVSVAGTDYTVNGVVVSNNEITNNVAVLTGNAAAADNFIVQGSGSLTANSSERTYNGVTEVVSQADDTVDLNDQNATVTAGGFNSQGIDFSHELVSNTGTLAGTPGDDSFNSNSANEIEIDINGAVVTFSGVDQLDGAVGNDELDINNSGAELTASGVLAQSINVTNVANYRNVGAMLGSSGDDSFDFIAAGAADTSWNSNTALFWGVTGIDAAAGTDSVIGTDMVDQFALVASAGSPSGFADNQVTYQAPTTSGILIENIEAVDGGGQDDILAVFNTGLEINSGANIVQGIDFQNFEVFAETGALTLLGNNASTSFLIEADGQVRDLSTGVLFIGVDALIGDVGLQNQVDLDGAGATLQAGGFNSRNIDISRITQVSNTGQIFGANESYQVQGNQSVLVNSINFAGVSEVSGGSSVVLNNAAAILNGARLVSSGISFVNINSFSQLSDLSGVQSFTVLNDNEIQTAGFRFSGLSSLEATSGDIGSRGAQLTSAGEILAAGISIRGLNSVSNTGQLVGTAQAERYELLPSNQLTIAGIQFSAVTGLDGAGGLDTIDLNGLGADLQSDGFTVGDFRISNIEEIANTGTVRGSTQDESFQIESNGSISVSGFNFSDVNLVDAGGGRDSLDVAGRGLNMLSLDSFSVEGITFSGVEFFSNTGALVLSDADDILSRDEEDKFSLLNYEFAAVSSVDAGAGSNSLQLAGLGLKIEGGSVASASVDLANIQSFTQVGELELSGFDANIELLAEQSFRVNDFQLQGVQILQAGAGSDRLDAAGFDSLLLENNNLLIADTEIRSVELIDNTNQLTGNNSDNSFSLIDIGIVESGSYRFAGVERIDGGGGQDSLSFAALETVAIDFETSSIGSIDYDGVEALQRFESIEQINLPNVQSLLLSGDAQLQVGDLNLDGDLNLAGQVQLDVVGDAGFTGGLAISDDSQLNVSGSLQTLGTFNSSGAASANIGSNVILGNGLQATDSSVITVAGDLSSQGDVDIIDDARLVLNGGLSTDTNLNLDGSGQLQVEGSVDVGGDLNALGQSNINSNSDINIVGQVTTSQTATINADSINVNVPEEKVVTVQPEINISLAVFSEIKVFINSNSSVRNSAETSALYSDDDLVDALIESAQEEEMDGAGEE